VTTFGPEWRSHIPDGVWKKAEDKAGMLRDDIEDSMVLLDETDLPNLKEIVRYKKSLVRFVQPSVIEAEEFSSLMEQLYDLRCAIAHVRSSFSAFDLDLLQQIARRLSEVMGPIGEELRFFLKSIQNDPEKFTIPTPASFSANADYEMRVPNNLPPADYDPEGGFIGRVDDLRKIETLILGNLHRVITISGAGGVGKTALAHRICQTILSCVSPILLSTRLFGLVPKKRDLLPRASS
jgi:hypothetical protein